MEEKLYWIWISRMENMYYEIFELLINEFKSLEGIWNAKIEDFIRLNLVTIIPPKLLNDIFNCNYRKNLVEYYKYMKNNQINIVSCFDKEYPLKLHFIENKPIVLYIKGNLACINKESAAIVGSRNCSQYGIQCTKKIVKKLAQKDVIIISGLARGIDSTAHYQAINTKCKTIAIVGTGLDSVYPKENKTLAEDIVKSGGAIISEFIVGTKADKRNFPRRNRIISGMANSVIVVEASEKSGSLITANFAINQGKEVWAVPGNIFNYTARGTNKLIQDGANVITEVDDILNSTMSN